MGVALDAQEPDLRNLALPHAEALLQRLPSFWMVFPTKLWTEGARGLAVADCGQESNSFMRCSKAQHLQMRVRGDLSG